MLVWFSGLLRFLVFVCYNLWVVCFVCLRGVVSFGSVLLRLGCCDWLVNVAMLFGVHRWVLFWCGRVACELVVARFLFVAFWLCLCC